VAVPSLGKNKLVLVSVNGLTNSTFQAWKDYGKDCPAAIVLGASPLESLISGAPLPEFVDKREYIGAIAGTAVRVVKCETNDNEVPANAEFVLEGRISVTETTSIDTLDEGYGYNWEGEKRQYPVFTVDVITHQQNPILPVDVVGTSVSELVTRLRINYAAAILFTLKQTGLPIIDVYLLPEALAWLVIKIDTSRLKILHTDSPTFRQKIGDLLWNVEPGILIHQAFLVDERVDITDFLEVMWAFATRSRPNLQQTFFDDVPANRDVPFMSRGVGNITKGSKVVTDCMFPYQYEANTTIDYEVCNFTDGYSKEIQDKVNSRWTAMGFATPP